MGLVGSALSSCRPHATVDMVENPRAWCFGAGCVERAVFGAGRRVVACERHALAEHRDMRQKECKTCGREHVLGAGGECGQCCPFEEK